MKSYISSVNMGSTKSHDNKKSNIRILQNDYIAPSPIITKKCRGVDLCSYD